MKSFLIAFFLATVFPSGVCMDLSEDLKEFVRIILSREFVDLKEDISHAVKTQSEKWLADNKQTRALVDILDEKQVNTVYSIKELREGLTNISYKTNFLLQACRSTFLENIKNLSNAIRMNDLHIRTFEEEMTLLHGKYWNQTDNLTELSKQVTHLSVQYNWTVSNISELHLNIRKMGEMSAEQILQTLARVNQTEDNLKRFFAENLQNETKELSDQFSMLRRDVTHLAESAVTQSEWSEQSINFLKDSLQNEKNELSGHISFLQENITHLSESAVTQADWTEKSILRLEDSLQNEKNELSGHISFLQENITHLSESAVTQADWTEKSILRLEDMVLQFCRQGWTKYRTSCYLASTKQMSWTSAKWECVRYGSKLVEIENKAENDFLKDSLIQDKGRYWTGGVDRVREGRWVWASSGNVFRYSDWAYLEPNNARYIEDCMELYMPKRAWNDASCQRENKFICEHFVKSS